MKKIIAAAAISAFVGTAAQAGGLMDAVAEQEVVAPVVVEEADGGMSPWIVAAIAALLIGVASSGSGSGSGS